MDEQAHQQGDDDGDEGLLVNLAASPEALVDEALRLHVEIGCRRYTSLLDARKAGRCLNVARARYDPQATGLPWKEFVVRRAGGRVRYGMLNVYKNIDKFWGMVESCASINEARRKIAAHRQREKAARRAEYIPGAEGAGKVPPVTRTKVVVQLSPVEAARQKLENECRQRIRKMSAAVAEYLAGDGFAEFQAAWKHLSGSWLGNALVPALRRRQRALEKLGAGATPAQKQEAEARFRLDLLTALWQWSPGPGRKRLTGDQRRLVAHYLGIADGEEMPLAAEVKKTLAQLILPLHIDANVRFYVARLLSPRTKEEELNGPPWYAGRNRTSSGRCAEREGPDFDGGGHDAEEDGVYEPDLGRGD